MATQLEGGHTNSVLTVECSKDGSGQVFSGGENGQICHWHHDGTLIGNLSLGEEVDITSVFCLKQRADLLYVSASSSIHLLDRRQFTKPLESYDLCDEEINQLTVNEKEEYLAACDDAGQIKIYNLATKKVFKTLRKHSNICASLAFRPKRPWDLLSAGYDQRLLAWDFSRPHVYCDINISEVGISPDKFDSYLVNPPFIHSIALSPSGNLLACGTENALVQVFDTSKKTPVYMTALHGHTHGVSQVHFPSFDDYTLISGGNDGTCNLWYLKNLAVRHQVNGYSCAAQSGQSTGSNASSQSTAAAAASPTIESETTSSESEIAETEEGEVGSDATTPSFSFMHGEKINWVTTGCTANRMFIVTADSTSAVTIFDYPQ